MLNGFKLDLNDHSGIDKRQPYRLTVHAHLAPDRAHRHALPRQAHGLILLVITEPRTAPRHLLAPEVGEDGGPVDAILLCQLLDARPGLVVGDQVVDLAGGEKSLNRLDSPRDRAAMVRRRGVLGPVADPVDAAIQAPDQRVGLRGEVAERATQAPQFSSRGYDSPLNFSSESSQRAHSGYPETWAAPLPPREGQDTLRIATSLVLEFMGRAVFIRSRRLPWTYPHRCSDVNSSESHSRRKTTTGTSSAPPSLSWSRLSS